MKRRTQISLATLVDRWKGRFWPVPLFLTVAITALLPFILSLDRKFFSQTFSSSIFVGYSPDAARLILSSICTSVMTVIGVLFSIIIVVIQQASSQYSPRIVDVFVRSRTSQFILGLYVGTFVYSILLLRQLPSGSAADAKIPQSAVTLGIFLALICIFALVHYVHFISHMIRSTTLIDYIRNETLHFIKRYMCFLKDNASRDSAENFQFHHTIQAQSSGYFQGFFPEKIDSIFRAHPIMIDIHHAVGSFVLKGKPIFTVRSQEKLPERKLKKLLAYFDYGPERTHAQDLTYGLRQLSDINLRALSPGINDPTTAMESLNAIEDILITFFRMKKDIRQLCLSCGTRFTLKEISTDEILKVALSQSIMAAKQHFQVLERIDHILKNLKASGFDLGENGERYLESIFHMLRDECFSGIYPQDETSIQH